MSTANYAIATGESDGVTFDGVKSILSQSITKAGGARMMTIEEYIGTEYHQRGLREGWEHGLKKGAEEGMHEGFLEGRQEGIQEGRQEGIQEGRHEGKLELAASLIKEGIDLTILAKSMDIPTETLKELVSSEAV